MKFSVSKGLFTNQGVLPVFPRINSPGICCLGQGKSPTDDWFGLDYALALGKPFAATIEEDDLSRILSLPQNGRALSPHGAPFAFQDGFWPDDRGPAITNNPDFDGKGLLFLAD